MSQDLPYQRTERYETIIIGGGPAALAAAHELQARDVDCLVLDPGLLLRAAPDAHVDLPRRFDVSVRSLRRVDAHFEILAGDLRYEATSVIVAMGPYQSPVDLEWIVEREPCLYFLDGNSSGGDAAIVAERIALAGL